MATTLTRRIAALLFAAATGVFALTAIGLEQALSRELAQRDAMELIGKVEQLRYLVGVHGTIAAIGADPRPFREVIIGHKGLGFRIANADGTEFLAVGEDVSAALRVGAAPDSAVPVDRQPDLDDVLMVDSGDLHWRVVSAEAHGSGNQRVRISIGRDVHASLDQRTIYRTVMLTGSLLGAFGTALIGSVVVWRGVRPLATMAGAARRISANRLAERVPIPASAPAEVRELAEAFNDMIDRLEEGFTRLSRFSADLAHDLRTPLANLLLQTQIGLSRARSTKEYETLLASNVEQFERLQRMVDGMLFLARADNAQIALRRVPLDLRDELERVAAYFELAAEERNVRLAVSGQACADADAELVRRAIGNLVSNAVRHARPGSEIQLRAAEGNGRATIEVSNEGEGITAADLPRVFDRFWRGDQARSASATSSGLGLSIVRSVAQLHGGDIAVDSSPDGPTTFRLSLPRLEALPMSVKRREI